MDHFALKGPSFHKTPRMATLVASPCQSFPRYQSIRVFPNALHLHILLDLISSYAFYLVFFLELCALLAVVSCLMSWVLLAVVFSLISQALLAKNHNSKGADGI